MTALELVGLTPLMDLTRGSPAVDIGLIDGPVARDSGNLDDSVIRAVPGTPLADCQRPTSVACSHGTFIAAMLSARRGGEEPAICPGCTLWVRPIFSEFGSDDTRLPSANPDELAAAILDCISSGTRVINLSLALAPHSLKAEQPLKASLDRAVLRGVILVAAAGNHCTAGSTVITRHPWVIPVMACDLQGRPAAYSNFGRSIGSRGLSAPGDSTGTSHFRGTSVAAPYVTGTIALLWSLFPNASAQQVKLAVTQPHSRRASVVSPLLQAWSAYQTLLKGDSRRVA